MEQQGRRAIGRVCPRGAESYTWQEGDTAENVARTYSTTVQALQVINPGVDFATLTAGEEICLPNFIYTCISGQPYVVEEGDTFASIAARLDITTFELAERNPGVSQNSLRIGQVLCVPARADDSDDSDDSADTDDAQTPAIPLPNEGEYPPQPDDSQTPVIPLPDEGEYPAQPDTPTRVCPSGYTLSAVQSGQSYVDLLVAHNVSYRAMRSANPQLMPGYLIAGTEYCAPPSGTRQTCAGLRSYTIQPEETLDTLAARLRTTRGRLLALNPTLLPSDFSSGTVICIG